jgi:chromate reductase
MTYTLLGLSGSLRREAFNRKLLNEAARLFDPAQYDQGDLNLPLYDGDLEEDQGIPDAVQKLVDQITAADAVIISTPEYNKGPSGVLKNALDWISRVKRNPWSDKPVAVMSAAAGRTGGEGAQTMLRANMVSFQPRLLPGPALHLAASFEAFDDNGRLISSQYISTLQALMDKLRAEIGR